MTVLASGFGAAAVARHRLDVQLLILLRRAWRFSGTALIALAIIAAAVFLPRPQLDASNVLVNEAISADPLLAAGITLGVMFTGLFTMLSLARVVRSRRVVLPLLIGYATTVLCVRALWALPVDPWVRVALGAVIGLAWLVRPSLITLNVAAVVGTYGFIVSWSAVDLRYVLLGGLAVVIYDVANVWLSRGIIEMVEHARERGVPLFIQVPGAGLLGLGDISIPGIMVLAGVPYGAAPAALVGYAAGSVLAHVVLHRWSRDGVPAMAFLVPCVLAGLLSNPAARAAALGSFGS